MTDKGMSLATLVAALKGDLENAIRASTPGGIEAQEARGQRDFVANETLPRRMMNCTPRHLGEMGIVLGEPVDDLFLEAQLPEGWKKVPTSHPMHTDLVDNKGRKRAGIFYKATFYDRNAFINLTRRFSFSVEPVCGRAADDYKQHEWHCVVTDCGETVWQSEERVEPEPEYQHGNEEQRIAWLDWDDRRDTLKHYGIAWLDRHYPDWENYLAYWD